MTGHRAARRTRLRRVAAVARRFYKTSCSTSLACVVVEGTTYRCVSTLRVVRSAGVRYSGTWLPLPARSAGASWRDPTSQVRLRRASACQRASHLCPASTLLSAARAAGVRSLMSARLITVVGAAARWPPRAAAAHALWRGPAGVVSTGRPVGPTLCRHVAAALDIVAVAGARVAGMRRRQRCSARHCGTARACVAGRAICARRCLAAAPVDAAHLAKAFRLSRWPCRRDRVAGARVGRGAVRLGRAVDPRFAVTRHATHCICLDGLPLAIARRRACTHARRALCATADARFSCSELAARRSGIRRCARARWSHGADERADGSVA